MRTVARTLVLLVGVASVIPATAESRPVARKQSSVFVSFGVPTTVGIVDVKSVTKAVKGRTKALERCHTPSKTSSGKDTMRLTLRIRADGITTSSATGLAAKANACVRAAVAKLKIPKPEDGQPAEVTYSITYSTLESARAATIASGLGGLGDVDVCADCGAGVGPPAGPGGWGKVSGPIGGGSEGQPGTTGRTGRPGRPRTPAAKVTLGRPTVSGGDPAMIRRHVKRSEGQLRYCYEKQLVANAQLRGTLTVTFTYGSDGVVLAARASGMKNTELESCVAAVFKALRFAEPSGREGRVSYPVSFAP